MNCLQLLRRMGSNLVVDPALYRIGYNAGSAGYVVPMVHLTDCFNGQQILYLTLNLVLGFSQVAGVLPPTESIHDICI